MKTKSRLIKVRQCYRYFFVSPDGFVDREYRTKLPESVLLDYKKRGFTVRRLKISEVKQ